MLQLSHRIKLSTLITLQLAPKDRLTAFLDQLNQYQLLEFKITIASVIPRKNANQIPEIPPITELFLMSGITYTEYA
jgi:hypothetical protein